MGQWEWDPIVSGGGDTEMALIYVAKNGHSVKVMIDSRKKRKWNMSEQRDGRLPHPPLPRKTGAAAQASLPAAP